MKLATKIERFEKLREWVREEPRRYNQRVWADTGLSSSSLVYLQHPPCGTVACLAGNAVLMSGFKIRFDRRKDEYYCSALGSRKLKSIREEAKKVLGLSEDGADSLFGSYEEGWDPRTRRAYMAVPRTDSSDAAIQARANAAIAELDIRIAAMRRELKRKGNITVPAR